MSDETDLLGDPGAVVEALDAHPNAQADRRSHYGGLHPYTGQVLSEALDRRDHP